MDNFSKANVVVIISFFVVILLFLKLCIFGYSRKHKFVQKAYKNDSYAKAYIVNNNVYNGMHTIRSANNFPSFNAKYQYTVKKKKYYKTYTFRARSGISSGSPYLINVYYKKRASFKNNR